MAREKCPRCDRDQWHCICSLVSPVPAQSPVAILQFPKEAAHPLNTAALLKASLPDCRVWVGEAFDGEPAVDHFLAQAPLLLYPSEEALPLEELPRQPRPLLLLDGTWKKAYRLYQSNPALKGLTAVRLPDGVQGRYRLRKSPKAEGLSTLEAAAMVLAHLEPGLDVAPLYQAMDAMIERQLGRMPAELRQRYQP
ncbi:tRNA-uridine aminocarboxypropyltransferase [Gallaecimonas sp. GXIMD4217]|uniref:tRNA-uridine aminocarboxypropyltransferase n=1 Tax=Gallaecimonas sp. GXIMD4217 TaxID=3131927 RepID=UPI00311ACB65